MSTVRDEIMYAIQEAKYMNMGNTVPTMTILKQAAKLAHVPIDKVVNVYEDLLEMNYE